MDCQIRAVEGCTLCMYFAEMLLEKEEREGGTEGDRCIEVWKRPTDRHSALHCRGHFHDVIVMVIVWST